MLLTQRVCEHVFKQIQTVSNSEILLVSHTMKSHHIAAVWNIYQQSKEMLSDLFSSVHIAGAKELLSKD